MEAMATIDSSSLQKQLIQQVARLGGEAFGKWA
jgi:hypothetical protein